MLELRPNCQLCDRDLPPNSADARICSYECTYCVQCVDSILQDVCPTCGGNFVPRPIRPKQEWRDGSGLGLLNDPASEKRRHSRWTRAEIDDLVQKLRDIPPQDR